MRSCLSSCLVFRNNNNIPRIKEQKVPRFQVHQQVGTESDVNFCIFNKNLLGQHSVNFGNTTRWTTYNRSIMSGIKGIM